MWDYVGLVRTQKKLIKAKDLLLKMQKETIQDNTTKTFNYELDSFKKLLLLAQLTVDSAIRQKQSIGSHYILED